MSNLQDVPKDGDDDDDDKETHNHLEYCHLSQTQLSDPYTNEMIFVDASEDFVPVLPAGQSLQSNDSNKHAIISATFNSSNNKEKNADFSNGSLCSAEPSDEDSVAHGWLSDHKRLGDGNISEACDAGVEVLSSSDAVSNSQSFSENIASSLIVEDDSSASVRLVSLKRLEGAESFDEKFDSHSNPLELIASYDVDGTSVSNLDSSRESLSNFFDTDDSGPFGLYEVTPDLDGEGNVASSNAQIDEEMATSETQRIRRKRLCSFSSSSSDDEESDTSMMSSETTSSRSKSNSSGSSRKAIKLDTDQEVNLNRVATDRWLQIRDVFDRQLGCVGFQHRVGGSLSLVQKLELYTKYERHAGCVNALNFNETGTLIASGSDDLQIVVWDWIKKKSFIEFDSGHRANVFQSKFMPYTGDCHIVSCARDGQVRLAQLSVTGTCRGTKKLAQHKGAAHKLAILPDSCHVFLSCGEDGVTYQIDLRQEKPIKLYTTKENNKYISLYSIHSNPFNSFEHCVGGRDPYIRIYDTRKIDNSDGAGVVKMFCPNKMIKSDMRTHVTCAVYNYNGTSVLGTYNDEDIYLFDNDRSDGAEYVHKYSGHRNSATVKGVNFYGPKSEFVVSGSDCGNIFLWDVESEAVVNFFHGDENGVINVLEPHPHIPMLATSGLDSDVKLWMPLAAEASEMKGLAKTMKKNKKERENEQNEPDVDSEMLWFLMHRLRRSAARIREEMNEGSSSDDQHGNSMEEDDDDNEDGEESRVQCSPS